MAIVVVMVEVLVLARLARHGSGDGGGVIERYDSGIGNNGGIGKVEELAMMITWQQCWW